MRRGLLTLMLAWIGICGCAGRMNVDLLQARIRQQEAQLAESRREIAKTQSELKQSRREAERLKSGISQTTNSIELASSMNVMQKVRINALASGGLNKDDLPGDDMVVVQFTPLDSENQPMKSPGDLEIALIDPQLPPSEREIGRWSLTADDCQDRWTRGITSSGFQFSLPFQQLPQHSDLVVQLQYTAQDSRRFIASQKIKVAVAPSGVSQQNNRQLKKRVQPVEDLEDPLPPVGDQAANENLEDQPDWDKEDQAAKQLTPGRTILHSSNWTDATIPQFR